MLKAMYLYLALLASLGVTWAKPQSQDAGRIDEHVESHRHKEHGQLTANQELAEHNRRYDVAWAQWRDELFGLDIGKGMIVADIGAGRGELGLLVARKVGPTGLVYANEIDARQLTVIGDEAARAGIQNIVPVLGRSDDPMIPPERVDMAIMVEVLHHVTDPPRFLKSIRRRVKPGARLAIVEPDVHQNGGNPDGCYSDPDSTRRQVERAGFGIVEVRTRKVEDLVFFVLVAKAQE